MQYALVKTTTKLISSCAAFVEQHPTYTVSLQVMVSSEFNLKGELLPEDSTLYLHVYP